MFFLVDANLPPWLAKRFSDRGHQDEHAIDELGASTPDRALLERARNHDGVIVTKDRDFIELIDEPPPYVLWIRGGNASNRKLHKLFEQNFDAAVAAFENREAVFEIK